MAIGIPLYLRIFYIVIPFIGISANISIIYVTIVDRRLRSPCNIMIALIAFGDIFHHVGQFIILATHDLAPEQMIRQDVCVHIQTMPLFGLCFSSVIMLGVAIDRILALKNIYFFLQKHQNFYLALQIGPAIAFSLVFNIWAYITVDERLVPCNIPDILTEVAANACFGTIAVLTVLSLFCYGHMIVSLRSIAARDEHTRGLMRSLILIGMTVIFGWLFTSILRFGAEFLGIKTEPRLSLDMHIGVFVNFSLGVNFFVYYFFSAYYREVFDKHLGIGILKRKLGISKKTARHSVSGSSNATVILAAKSPIIYVYLWRKDLSATLYYPILNVLTEKITRFTVTMCNKVKLICDTTCVSPKLGLSTACELLFLCITILQKKYAANLTAAEYSLLVAF